MLRLAALARKDLNEAVANFIHFPRASSALTGRMLAGEHSAYRSGTAAIPVSSADWLRRDAHSQRLAATPCFLIGHRRGAENPLIIDSFR